MYVCGCESWKRWVASDPPWHPQTASCNTNNNTLYQAVSSSLISCRAITFLYLGDPKKPPLSAPRQDRDTRMGITEAKPWSARLANVCRETYTQ